MIEFRLMSRTDEAAVLDFAQKLPTHDLLFLPRNISQPKVLSAWINEIERGAIISLLAVKAGKVVGCGTVVRDPHSWSPHVGEIRMVVSPDVRGLGVGRALSQETFALALGAGPGKAVGADDGRSAGRRLRCSRASASRLRRCYATMSATSMAGSTTSSCSGIMWRRSGPRWKPMACRAPCCTLPVFSPGIAYFQFRSDYNTINHEFVISHRNIDIAMHH